MSGSVNPEMLILARESRGYTQGKLAEETGISQANISKYESGLLNVAEAHVWQIAKALHYPMELFFLTERRYGFGSSCTYHRKRQTMPVWSLKVILSKLNLRRIALARYLNGVDIESENNFPRFDLDEYDNDVERIAGLVRETWKLPNGPVSNLVRAIEGAGGIVLKEYFGTRKLDAVSQVIPGLPPVFLINAEMPGDRLRFTLAHELGHIIMHTIPTDDVEGEADRFASEFLMPARDIVTDLDSLKWADLARLKSYWKVSIAALITRARDLGKISPRQYQTLFEKRAKSGYNVKEPIPIPIEEPTLSRSLIDFYRDENGYTVAELSRLAVLEEQEFLATFYPSSRKLGIVRGVG
jgi:Zn-dependent peptidase ImmA (M78 family)/DNA-binding XRE family transcriptional regulator